MIFLKQKINSFQAAKAENNHHRAHEMAAWRNINTAIALNGWELTEENRSLCDDYAVRVFGRKAYAPWLYFFTLFSGEFKEGWIPLNYYSKFVLPDPSLARVSSVKTFSRIVLDTDALPDIAYYMNGMLYNRDFSPIKIAQLKALVEKTDGVVFVKADNSLRGRNVHMLHVEDFNDDTFQKIGNSVIQHPVRQHDFFNQFVLGPTATIRVITVRNLRGEIEHRTSYAKFGREGKNFYQSEFAVWAPIVDDTGRMDDFCYTTGYQKMSAHPDTQVGFSGKKVPQFSECVALCMKLHQTIQHFPIIGWDLAVDQDENVKIFEWNAGAPHPDIRFPQAVLGPCFAGLGWEELRK